MISHIANDTLMIRSEAGTDYRLDDIADLVDVLGRIHSPPNDGFTWPPNDFTWSVRQIAAFRKATDFGLLEAKNLVQFFSD